jgi:hypothetical protein
MAGTVVAGSQERIRNMTEREKGNTDAPKVDENEV